ncbi:hypothetical protein [Tolypothrix sp. VBCCA 56010]|uniref:hypothetical protein n=1 Tax=Tolypothrix sp. VBCCA 56010 TaxID=3137731 RepID=UPI003D7E9076
MAFFSGISTSNNQAQCVIFTHIANKAAWMLATSLGEAASASKIQYVCDRLRGTARVRDRTYGMLVKIPKKISKSPKNKITLFLALMILVLII